MEVKLTTEDMGRKVKEKFDINVIDGMLVVADHTYQYICVNLEEFSEVLLEIIQHELPKEILEKFFNQYKFAKSNYRGG